MQDLLRWAALAGKGEGPGSRSSHSITAAADGAKLYLFGGEHTARYVTTRVAGRQERDGGL